MRQRESKSRDDELALVVAWMGRWAAALRNVAANLLGEGGPVATEIRARCLDEAQALDNIARALERREHRL